MRTAAALLVLVALCAPSALSLATSKLSIHTGLGTNSWNFIKQAQPRVVKILDNFGGNPAQVAGLSLHRHGSVPLLVSLAMLMRLP